MHQWISSGLLEHNISILQGNYVLESFADAWTTAIVSALGSRSGHGEHKECTAAPSGEPLVTELRACGVPAEQDRWFPQVFAHIHTTHGSVSLCRCHNVYVHGPSFAIEFVLKWDDWLIL
jgi:hypothetical protein